MAWLAEERSIVRAGQTRQRLYFGENNGGTGRWPLRDFGRHFHGRGFNNDKPGSIMKAHPAVAHFLPPGVLAR